MNAKWMDYRLGILAGQDIWCGQKGSMGTLDGSGNDPAITNAVQRAAKNVIYSVTRSSAMNIGNATVISVTPAWKIVLRIAAIASTALTVCFAALCVIRHRKNKKGEESA